MNWKEIEKEFDKEFQWTPVNDMTYKSVKDFLRQKLEEQRREFVDDLKNLPIHTQTYEEELINILISKYSNDVKEGER